jgi:hypothetical protein
MLRRMWDWYWGPPNVGNVSIFLFSWAWIIWKHF